MGGVILHEKVAGRLRLRLNHLFRNPRACDEIIQTISGVPGVTSVKANPQTGSLLLYFDSAKTHQELLAELKLVRADVRRAPLPLYDISELIFSSPRSHSVRSSRAIRPTPGAIAWHTLSSSEALKRLSVDAALGLTCGEAGIRLSKTGLNKLAERRPTDPFIIMLKQFKSLPVALLIGAAAFSFLTGGIAEAAITFAVILTNAGIGFGVEQGSERVILEMTQPHGHFVPVLRDGGEVTINSHEIVPGDILILRPNVVITADARVLASDGLLINEALLTGESQGVAKSADARAGPDSPLADRANMVFRGAFVAAGSGRAVVVATGIATEVGRLALAGQEVATPITPLKRDLEKLGAQLALVSLAICSGFFALGVLRGWPIASVLKSAIALAVAAVPEGLTVTSTATLALGLHRLKQKGILVRRLESVEALGSMQVLCFDKTGTLTLDGMDVVELRLGDEEQAAHLEHGQEPPHNARRLGEISILCSEVVVERTSHGERLSGSATETALVRAAIDMGLDPEALRKAWPQRRLEYRTDGHRYMVSHHCGNSSAETLIAIKGDPIQLLQMCASFMRTDGSIHPLDQAMRDRLLYANDDMAGRGLRVLGFAFAEGSAAQIEESGLVWVGMAGLKAPIFTGARELLSRLHRAGIRPVMITGDQSATAEAIAREIGLTDGRPVRVLDAVALSQLPPDMRDAVIQRTDVFARVPPSQKLEIVRSLQRSGKIVGMAGDGFNDALALKAADIAIAVGAFNASAARDVADVIVTGPDLNVIGDGIEQGRAILSNIRKSVHFMTSTNLSEILVILAESFSAREEIETPLELLWLNLVTDILPGMGLALEPPEENVMTVPPREASEPLLRLTDLHHAVQEALIMGGSILGAHAFGLSRYGPGNQTRTVTFLSLVATQLLHALTCRHDRFVALGGRSLFGNGALNLALAGSSALQAIPLIWPSLGRLLGVGPMRVADLAAAGLSGIASFGLNETLLALRSRRRRMSPQTAMGEMS